MRRRRRWTIHVCTGCGSYAGTYDLEPRFGNIVGHERMTQGCTEEAEVVEVVALKEVREVLENAYHPQNPVPDHPADLIDRKFGFLEEDI